MAGFNKVLTSIGIVGVLLLAISRPYGLAVLNWELSAWWVLGPVGLLLVYGLMKANYERFAMIEREENENQTAVQALIQENKSLRRLIRDLEPARIFCENWKRQEEEDQAFWPAQQLERETTNLISDIRNLLRGIPRSQAQSGMTLSQALATRPKPSATPDEIVGRYDRDFASEVLVMKSKLDALGLRTDVLGNYCTQSPRTLETIKRTVEALEALAIQVEPMTHGND